MMRAVLMELLGLYRAAGSSLLPPSCRFHPSCSDFAEEALRTHSPLRASWLILGRLARCHPLHPGGLDPVPGANASLEWRPGRSGSALDPVPGVPTR